MHLLKTAAKVRSRRNAPSALKEWVKPKEKSGGYIKLREYRASPGDFPVLNEMLLFAHQRNNDVHRCRLKSRPKQNTTA